MKKDQNQKLDIPEITLSETDLPEEEEQQKSSFWGKINSVKRLTTQLNGRKD